MNVVFQIVQYLKYKNHQIDLDAPLRMIGMNMVKMITQYGIRIKIGKISLAIKS